MKLLARYLPLLLTVCLAAATALAEVPVYGYRVVNSFPHDPQAFTQGLVYHNDFLYEGTGRNGASSLRRVALDSGEVLQRRNLSTRYFGEGITILGQQVFQLTWQSHLGFVYKLDDFSLERSFFLPGEGWGITHDGEQLIVSDGSAILRFLDPESLKESRRVAVTEDGLPLDRLNELEYIDGEVWANVWYTDTIARIDPATGQVTGKIDLGGLHEQRGQEDVTNGIAWDAANERLFVTGKLWPTVYEIELVAPTPPRDDVPAAD